MEERITFALPPEKRSALRRIAAASGLFESQLVRRGVDLVIAEADSAGELTITLAGDQQPDNPFMAASRN